MIDLKYPKIDTLYKRDEHFRVTKELNAPEFDNIKRWWVTEKIDGMNIRIALHADGTMEFGGRNENTLFSQMTFRYLNDTFTAEMLQDAFESKPNIFVPFGKTWPEIVVFGEGYGAGIQKGGHYRPDISFRMFDVNVGGLWLEPEDILDVAEKLNVNVVPLMSIAHDLPVTSNDLKNLIEHSVVANSENQRLVQAEGVVARPVPMLLNRRGERVMWKLKFKDFW